jgi:hypothetical protein
MGLLVDVFIGNSFSASRVPANFGAVWQQFVAFHQMPLSLAMRTDPRFFPTAGASHPLRPPISAWEVVLVFSISALVAAYERLMNTYSLSAFGAEGHEYRAIR